MTASLQSLPLIIKCRPTYP